MTDTSVIPAPCLIACIELRRDPEPFEV